MMGKLKDAVIEAEQFAIEHYNIPRYEFMWELTKKYGSTVGTLSRVSLAHWDEIQHELHTYLKN
jgi:ferritin-like metal-binding protein YciE